MYFVPYQEFFIVLFHVNISPLFSRNWVNLIVKNQNIKIISINDVSPNLNIIVFGFPYIRKDFFN